MPKAKVNGINMYYEIYGEGPPLVLIEGLGYDSWMWYRQVDELKQDFQLIVFDNRGVGESDKPDEPYSIEMFAKDTKELLKQLGIEQSHLLGVSMGGFIAQEFAYRYPEMVNKLVLCSTSFGGPNSIPIPQKTLEIMQKGGGDYDSHKELREAIGIALGQSEIENNQDIIDKILQEKSKIPQPQYAYLRQLKAGASFNGEDKAKDIKSDTLILAGDEDQVVPSENTKLLHEAIPHSKFKIISKTGHLFFMEKPEVTNKIIKDFLLNE